MQLAHTFNKINLLRKKTYIFSFWMHEIKNYISEIQLGPTYYYYRKKLNTILQLMQKSFALSYKIFII